MKRKYLKADLARDLGVSPALVSRDAKRGMPTHSAEAARKWRQTYLTHERVNVGAAVVAVAVGSVDLGAFAENLLAAASERICASIMFELGVSIEQANLAVSCVSSELFEACAAMGVDGASLYFAAGPLSYGPPPAEIAAARARIEARVAELRAELGDE
jgi:hypothetical protein